MAIHDIISCTLYVHTYVYDVYMDEEDTQLLWLPLNNSARFDAASMDQHIHTRSLRIRSVRVATAHAHRRNCSSNNKRRWSMSRTFMGIVASIVYTFVCEPYWHFLPRPIAGSYIRIFAHFARAYTHMCMHHIFSMHHSWFPWQLHSNTYTLKVPALMCRRKACTPERDRLRCDSTMCFHYG